MYKRTPNPTTERTPISIRVAQVIMLFPLGLLVVFGGFYFGFIHQIEVMGVGEYAVGVWAIVQGGLAIFTAIKLGSGRPFYRTLATFLMCGHLLFGVVKLVFWQETAAIPFMTLDAIVLALLARASTGSDIGVSREHSRAEKQASAPTPESPTQQAAW
jgi:hypothetical protein